MTQNMGKKFTGSIYEIISESRMVHGIEILGIKGGLEIVDYILWRYCKRVLRLAPSTVNGAAGHGLAKDSRREKMFCTTAQFWCRILYR
jgi:hypothetical protein